MVFAGLAVSQQRCDRLADKFRTAVSRSEFPDSIVLRTPSIVQQTKTTRVPPTISIRKRETADET